MDLSHELLIKMMLSIIIGGVIGIEREIRSKSAGLRTIMLICLGATLFTIFSQILGAANSPDRIASNVVVGIGFIGAGVVYRNKNRVNGITTAASIWLSAALGVGIGCGYYLAACIGCLLVVSILFMFTFFDHVLDKINQVREYTITFTYEEHQHHKYELLLHYYGLKILQRSEVKKGNIITGSWVARGHEKKHHAFIERVLDDSSVSEFAF